MKKYITGMLIVILSGLFSQVTHAKNEDAIVTDYVNWLKTIPLSDDKNYIQTVLEKMNGQWEMFAKDNIIYTPIVRQHLQSQLTQKSKSQLVLMDLALFLAQHDKTDASQLIGEAIRNINIEDPVITQFSFLYYQLLIVYSYSTPKDFLPILDRVLIPNQSNEFQVFQPKTSQDVAMYRLHAFGVYGLSAVEYLLSQLIDNMNITRKETILSILRYTCTRDCNGKIFDLVKNGAEHMILVHATFALLDTGGPEGRDLFLQIPIKKYRGKSIDWLKSEFEYAKKLSYSHLIKKFEYEHATDNRTYSNDEFRVLMENMIDDPMVFLNGHPHDFMNSTMDKELLFEKLIKIRKTIFRIATVHGRDYVKQVNEIMNALYYKNNTTKVK